MAIYYFSLKRLFHSFVCAMHIFLFLFFILLIMYECAICYSAFENSKLGSSWVRMFPYKATAHVDRSQLSRFKTKLSSGPFFSSQRRKDGRRERVVTGEISESCLDWSNVWKHSILKVGQRNQSPVSHQGRYRPDMRQRGKDVCLKRVQKENWKCWQNL